MLAGVPVHLIQRGNNRSACFVTEEDRGFYLFHLGRGLARFGCELHAYCLMTNHVHLLLTPASPRSCGLLMKHQGQLHTQYFNKVYKRTGSLWEGRFRSCLVQSESYLLTCYCYIERNPVRAHIVAQAAEYPWSSHRENLTGSPGGLVTPHYEYLRLGTTPAERQRAYSALVGAPADPAIVDEIRSATNGGYALGHDEFRKATAKALGRRVEKGKAGRPTRDPGAAESQQELPLPTENVACP